MTKQSPTNPLTREQKIERLKLLEEKQRRLLSAKPIYTPNDGQLPVHLSSAKERWCLSANGSGKTTALVNEVHWAATGFNPITKEYTKAPCKIVVVVDKSDKVGEVFLPEYERWNELKEEQKLRSGKPYVSKIAYPNGSTVSFYTAESDPMGFEGFMADYVFLDEPIPRPLIVALRRSLRIKGSPARLTFFGTPISQAWIRREVYEPSINGTAPHIKCFRMGIWVNEKNLKDGYIDQFGSGLSEAERKTRLEGAFFDADALALADHFKEDVHIVKDSEFNYDYRMPCVVAVDPHMAKPTTAVMLCVDRDDNYIVIKEATHRGNATQFADFLKSWEKGYNVVDRVCDSLGATEKTSGEGMHSFIDGVLKANVMIRSTTFKEKNAEDLVDRLRQGLAIPLIADAFGRKNPKLRVHEHCRRLIADISQVAWQKSRMTGEMLPKLDTTVRDYLSCLGYCLATAPYYDIIKHSAPRYKSESLPVASPERKELEAHRSKVIKGRMARTRSRFLRRITGS